MGGEIPEIYRSGGLPGCNIRGWCDVMTYLGAKDRIYGHDPACDPAAQVANELELCSESCPRFSLFHPPVDLGEEVRARLEGPHAVISGALACRQTTTLEA